MASSFSQMLGNIPNLLPPRHHCQSESNPPHPSSHWPGPVFSSCPISLLCPVSSSPCQGPSTPRAEPAFPCSQPSPGSPAPSGDIQASQQTHAHPPTPALEHPARPSHLPVLYLECSHTLHLPPAWLNHNLSFRSHLIKNHSNYHLV